MLYGAKNSTTLINVPTFCRREQEPRSKRVDGPLIFRFNSHLMALSRRTPDPASKSMSSPLFMQPTGIPSTFSPLSLSPPSRECGIHGWLQSRVLEKARSEAGLEGFSPAEKGKVSLDVISAE